jgi:D-alanyl-D-alanine carboxypeptidase/D-alanyl-D-alanine-endopeptidase (penicillin-binding protein 4)
MLRGTVALVVAVTPALAAIARAQAAPERAPRRTTTVPALAARLEPLLDAAPFDRAHWGVVIADPAGRVVFERNGDRLFTPASNTKLIVAAVAAALLPPDYRFRTSVYGTAPIRDGVLGGDLVLYGRGDPTLSRRYYTTRLAPFEALASQLASRGLARVTGDLIADASWFDSVLVHPSWESYDVNWWYGASVTALGFNDNSVDFRITPASAGNPPLITMAPDLDFVQFANRAVSVPADSPRTLDFNRVPGTNIVWAEGGVPVDARPWEENFAVVDAPGWAGAALRQALAYRGIVLEGRIRTVYDSSVTIQARYSAPLAEIQSRPLAAIIGPVLESSHNWYAEILLKTLGRELRGRGTWQAGLEVERRFLIDSLRVDSTSFRLADGSGLSHWNLVTPRAFVQILAGMQRHPRFQTFRDALPVAGRTGTLRNRFRGTQLFGRVRAKTGSIAGVNTLSGYAETPSGTWTFSIQLNNHTARNREALRQIDELVAAFAR